MMRGDMLPIYVGAAMACCLVWAGRRELRTAFWLPATALALAAGMAATWLPSLGADQYNLRELLRTDKPFAGMTLAAILLWTPLSASLSASMWSRGKRLAAGLWTPAAALVAWGLLRRSATVESIHDILGSPILSWPLDLEYVARFSAIYLPFAWVPLAMPQVARESRKGAIACAALSALIVIFAPAIIYNYSYADNVRELFRPRGGHWFALLCLLAGWCPALRGRAVLLAVPAAAVGWCLLAASVRVDTIHGLSLTPLAFMAAFVFYIACSRAGGGHQRSPASGKGAE